MYLIIVQQYFINLVKQKTALLQQLPFLNMALHGIQHGSSWRGKMVIMKSRGFSVSMVVAMFRESFNRELAIEFTFLCDLGLTPSSVPPELYQKWPFPFKLLYTVILRPQSLSTFISVKNEGSVAFDFHTLLHTYFSIPVSK